MDIQKLIAHLDDISRITNQQWLQSLNDRKLKELQFHNADRDKQRIKDLDSDTYEKFYGNKKFYKTVNKSKKYLADWIKSEAKGKVFLDYACGNGNNALLAAQAGALLSIGLDISDVSISNAKEEANRLGLTNVYFLQADAENTMIPDDSVDIIICSGMLHHLDLSYAFPELRRILAEDGKILVCEALDYNPFIKLYRFLTPLMRTEWEKAHILSMKDVRFAKHFFCVRNIRYWHIAGYLGAYVPFIQPVLNAVDQVLSRIPVIRLMAWIFTFELISIKNGGKLKK
jgi:ubiquinone/menaquinone biosynthesis C-methylase UbiE